MTIYRRNLIMFEKNGVKKYKFKECLNKIQLIFKNNLDMHYNCLKKQLDTRQNNKNFIFCMVCDEKKL